MTDGSVTIEHDGTPLCAEITLPGGKHGFAHTLAAVSVAHDVELTNVPANSDALALIDALRLVFSCVEHDRDAKTLLLAEPFPPGPVEWPPELVGRSRNLFCLLPATLHHRGHLRFAGAPAGCEIGVRPTDWYIRTMEQFGATVRNDKSATELEWVRKHSATIAFEYPSMTGTVIAVAAAAAVGGTSIVTGSSAEPSCREEIEALAANGVEVGRVADHLTVRGGTLGKVRWEVGADRIHAVTLLTAGLLTRGKITVRFARDLRIPRFLEFCKTIGAHVLETPGTLTIAHPTDRVLQATDVVAGSEPAFSSDWAPFAALLLATRAEGRSSVLDDVFINRFQFFDRLRPAGLTNVAEQHTNVGERPAVELTIDGRSDTLLTGTIFEDCPDIRGSAALLLASLVADGPCSLPRLTHLQRGYEDLPSQLRSLGVAVVRRSEATR